MSCELWLDFDRVLFDTDQAVRVWGDNLPALLASRQPFREGELSRFVFEDAWRFLEHARAAGMAVHVISSFLARSTGVPSNERFQRAKIAATGLHAQTRTVHVTGEAKGPYLARHRGAARWPKMVFVDDMPEHLRSVEQACPGVRVVHMDRSGRGGWGGHAVASFDELPGFLVSVRS